MGALKVKPVDGPEGFSGMSSMVIRGDFWVTTRIFNLPQIWYLREIEAFEPFDS